MKKSFVLLFVAISFSATLSQAYIQDTEANISPECRDLAQHILKTRSEEKLVKAQIKMADSREKKSLELKLKKIQADIGSSKEEFKLACRPVK